MSHKYMTGGFGDNLIEKVEIVKETEKTVWVKQYWRDKESIRQERKDSSWHKYFDTFQDAKNFLITECDKRIENCNDEINREKSRLNKINSIKEF